MNAETSRLEINQGGYMSLFQYKVLQYKVLSPGILRTRGDLGSTTLNIPGETTFKQRTNPSLVPTSNSIQIESKFQSVPCQSVDELSLMISFIVKQMK